MEKPNFNWTPKVDGVDDASAEDINLVAEMAQSGIDLGYEANKRLDELPETPTIDESNLVHKNGFEEINGFKMFHDGIDTPRISYDGDLVLHNSFVELKLTTDYKVVINDKEVALKEDITTAIQEAILDSWAEVIEP